ncbi:MAG: 2-succinyl-5-enolpyruvyl-6-hydroxy-3-cyclohexene-1-carboxylic-acid synthase [Symploca sp. SIO3E6]|nr:2-succinyl-5-enolpyruvyl-6-hydroxy-3-cyclohexene-1-carboxylic-acid synthase [Caldora sp. SIO3E6]
MPIDFRNINTIWSSILVETLSRLGLTTAVVCPGSRSTPLTVAFAQRSQTNLGKQLEVIPVLDERSAAFFALGIARQSGCPVVLVCTSGTAAANFYPAVIEARESRVPLLVLTADRPPELRDCHSGQTIDQIKLYGNYPNWQVSLAVPSVEIGMLRYLRQTVIHAWERTFLPDSGPVHLNLPFREPLAPVPQLDTDVLPSPFDLEDFFAAISPASQPPSSPVSQLLGYLYQEWQQEQQGIIIAGPAQPQNPRAYCEAIAQLCQTLGWPVLAEGLSPVRNYAQLNPYLISTYDLILRNQQLAHKLKPTMVIQIGELPTSKKLRAWLNDSQPQRWVIDSSNDNLDSLHGQTTHLRIDLSVVSSQWLLTPHQPHQITETPPLPSSFSPYHTSQKQNHKMGRKPTKYRHKWCAAEAKVRAAVDQRMSSISDLFEGKAAWLFSQTLPPETPLFIANSMPVRDIEYFWSPGNLGIRPYFNRGANGIDGTLSTALGIAHQNQSSVILTGDLALLHDTNGFLLRSKFVGHLTIVLINNNGGGIFEMLPISQFEPPFEEFFATPQAVNFAQLCRTYGVEHQLIESWEELKPLLNPLPTEGIRVLELRTNRKADAKWRKENLGKFAVGMEK